MPRRYVGRVPGLATRGETSYFGAPAARDDHEIDELGREEAVLDDARLSVESLRELARLVDQAEEVRDHASVRTTRGVRAEPGIAERCEGCLDGEGTSSSGTGGRSRSTGLSEEAMTTKRWAAAARIFSRVWAAPPPLISQPVKSIWSAPSIARSSLPATSSERRRRTVEPLPSPTTIPGSISRAPSRAAASCSRSVAGAGVSDRGKGRSRCE